jgi:hypothetical protein
MRAFDPCLSCSTHAIGKMPMVIGSSEQTATSCAGCSVIEDCRVLVVGYRNDLRANDGAGRVVADRIEAMQLPGVAVWSVSQLTPGLALEITGRDRHAGVHGRPTTRRGVDHLHTGERPRSRLLAIGAHRPGCRRRDRRDRRLGAAISDSSLETGRHGGDLFGIDGCVG